MGHKVSVQELKAWLQIDGWEIFASARAGKSAKHKRLEVKGGTSFRVTVGDDIKYTGPYMAEAVRIYNEL